MTNQTNKPTLAQAFAAAGITTASQTTAQAKTGWQRTVTQATDSQAKLEKLGRKHEIKRKDKLPSTASLIANKLVLRMEAEASIFCPISGLTAPAGGLPSTMGYYLTAYHPIAFNCWAILEQPAYVASLSNELLAGLVLACLTDLGKINYGRGDKATHAYLVRAKLEAIASRDQLLDLIEWIQATLTQTTIYYPPFTTDHLSLTLASLEEWMTWTYSIEVYAFEGSAPTLIKEPKKLAPVSADTQLKRLNAGLFEEWTNLLLDVDFLPKAFKDKAAKLVKQLATGGPVVNKMLAALGELASDDAGKYGQELVSQFISEVEEARELANKIQAKQLEEDWGFEPEEALQPATKASFIEQLKAEKAAMLASLPGQAQAQAQAHALAASQSVSQSASQSEEQPKKLSFREMLAQRKAAQQSKESGQ